MGSYSYEDWEISQSALCKLENYGGRFLNWETGAQRVGEYSYQSSGIQAGWKKD